MIDFFEKKLNILIGMKKQIELNINRKKEDVCRFESDLKLLEEAQIFLQKIAQETQSNLKFQIEDIVNLALETCFPNEYEFKLDFEIIRGKTEARLLFLSQSTGREIDPMNASGGGVVDLTAFALRISSYILERESDNVIIFDEPFRFVSRDLQERAGQILKTLSEKLKLQIILITHTPELVNIADKVFEVKKIDNVSKVRVV